MESTSIGPAGTMLDTKRQPAIALLDKPACGNRVNEPEGLRSY